MTNIVGISALQDLKEFKGFEEAIIAGGFCRDGILGGPFKDLDIFIPAKNTSDFKKIVENAYESDGQVKAGEVYKSGLSFDDFNRLWKTEHEPWERYDVIVENGNYTVTYLGPTKKNIIGKFNKLEFTDNKVSRYIPTDGYLGKFDCKYMDFLDVDIIGYTPSPDQKKTFGEHVVNLFSYNIDKVYFDGDQTVLTKEFERDAKYMEATLCRLDDLSQLPAAIKKFERLKEKYPKIMFKTNCLEIKEKK